MINDYIIYTSSMKYLSIITEQIRYQLNKIKVMPAISRFDIYLNYVLSFDTKRALCYSFCKRRYVIDPILKGA